jgi:diguanylate cyclase (GGDEF)-like protein
VIVFARFINLLKVPADKPELVLAQVQAFSRQVPLLYLVLLANIGFVAATHFNVAPAWLTLGIPSVFAVVAILRIIGWLKTRKAHLTATQAVARLRSTVALSIFLGSCMTAWSLMLLPYGDSLQRGHVAFFMTATLVACVFCLMHLRAAAILLSAIVAIPFCLVFASHGGTVPLAIAANMALVTLAMMYVLSNHYDDFARMVEQRTDLIKVNETTLRLSDENQKLASEDPLTSLPNRRSFISLIDENILHAQSDESFAVGLIDLDGFKGVNDLFGHAAGDALLVTASQRLKALSGQDVIFARLGGDEFGFVAKDISMVTDLGEKICATLAQPYSYSSLTLNVSASSGISLFPESCSNTSELLEFADFALYQAKQHNTGKALVFTASHRDQLHLSHQIDQALRTPDVKQEMRLHYQPVYCLRTGAVVGLEALARWRSDKLGPIAPGQFIATAERSVLIYKLTETLLQRLLDDIGLMSHDLRISFNLSAKCLASPEAMLKILSCIQRSGVDPKRLEFEITETALVANFDAALRSLQLLRNLGAAIALDDFGTGYSSLSYVHQLPLDKIKIDRGFVANLCEDDKAKTVVNTIIGLSQDLGIQCVAEGVETAEQARLLAEAGCDMVQGYHFAVPMPPDVLTGFLVQHNVGLTQKKSA